MSKRILTHYFYLLALVFGLPNLAQASTGAALANPEISCPPEHFVTTDAGLCEATVTLPLPTTSDDGMIVTTEFRYAEADADDNVIGPFSPFIDASMNVLSLPVGRYRVRWRTFDDENNTVGCNAYVSVTDQEPTIDCTGLIFSQSNDAGQCAAYVDYPEPSYTGNCETSLAFRIRPVDPVSGSPIGSWSAWMPAAEADDTYEVGRYKFHWAVREGEDILAECYRDMTITDTEAPTINCTGLLFSQPLDEGQCSAYVDYPEPAFSDNCEATLQFRIRTVNYTTGVPTSPWSEFMPADQADGTYDLGRYKFHWVVTDPSGQIAECYRDMTITDNEAPVLDCVGLDLTVYTDEGSCFAAVELPVPSVEEDCIAAFDWRYVQVDENGNELGPFSDWMPASEPYGTFAPGSYRIRWRVKDNINATVGCNVQLTVVDSDSPSLQCPGDLEVPTDPDQCGAFVELPLPEVSDNCGAGVLEFRYVLIDEENNELGPFSDWMDYSEASLFFEPGRYRVRWRAFDPSGNTAGCNAFLTVVDDQAPQLQCGGLNLTVANDPGLCSADVELPVPGVDDNCEGTLAFRYREVDEDNNPLGPWTDWADVSEAYSTFPVGRYRIRWSISDAAGNSDACTRFLTVEDVEPPIINCTNHEVVFNGEEYIDLYVPDLATAADNCGVASVELSINRIFCDELGDEVTVVATATDVNGLTSVCTSKVDVLGLPCGWSQDPDGVGCEDGNAVSYSVPLDEFTVNSTDCHNPVTTDTDEYAFAQYTLCGDGMITAQVTSITGTFGGWAGVTMRAGNDADDQMVSLMTNLSNQHRTEMRLTAGGNVTSSLSPSFNRHWLRIQRIGNNFRGFVSFNGLSWFNSFNIYVPMDACIEIGLIVNSSSASGDNSATFANVAVVGDPVFDSGPSLELQQWAAPEQQFSLYPNPTSGRVTVQLGDFLDQEGELEVMDVNGQRIRSVRKGLLEYATEEVDLTDLPAGIYFVRLRLNDGTMQTQRVVLQPRP